MNIQQREEWVNEVLKEVLLAAIQSPELREALIFKGAWTLNLHLQEDRHSMDIDAAAGPEWVGHHPDRNEQELFLRDRLQTAVRRHFERQNPARYALDAFRIERNPPDAHPRGWDMFRIILNITDRRHAGVRGLPPAIIEISAPEQLGPHAIEEHVFRGVPARMYSLHRVAGEKMRAYLTSLPDYRNKRGGGEREFRVKDLHDLARIVRSRPITDGGFWEAVAEEFKLACASRFVDCAGPETFKQDWPQARLRYEQDRSLQRIPFAEAESALEFILRFFETIHTFPLNFEAPPLPLR
jgi:hypothetical protein